MTGQGHSPPQESPHFKQHQSSQELLIFDNSRQFSVNTTYVQLRLYYERFTLGLNTQKESFRCETGSLYTLQTCWGLVKQNIHIKSHKADLLLKDNPQGKVAALQCHILDLQGSGSLARWTFVCILHGSLMPHTEGPWKIIDLWFYTPKVQESLGKGIEYHSVSGKGQSRLTNPSLS